MMRIILLSYIFTNLFFINAIGQSVLSEGNWFKIKISKAGVYKLDYQYLGNAGIPVNNIDPKTFKLFGQSSGMLPQANSSDWPIDPLEIAIEIKGEEDGGFNNADYILFYAQDGDSYFYEDSELIYEHNIYSDDNYYFLTYGGAEGKRISSLDSPTNSNGTVNTYNDFKYYKEESSNLLTSGRNWYSYRFNTTTSRDYDFSFPNNIVDNSIQISVNVMAQAFEPSSFNIKTNNQLIGNIGVQNINDFNQKIYRYDTKGYENKGIFNADANQNVTVTVEYNKNSSHSIGFLNDILLEAKCALVLQNNQLIFRSLESTSNVVTKYEVSNTNSASQIWNVTDVYNVGSPLKSIIGNVLTFNDYSSELKEYVVFNPDNIEAPASINQIENQDLKSNTDSEFVIISADDFLYDAERLASFRMSNDGMNTTVVTPNQIYNEFSGGRQDVSAIRNYVKYLYENGQLKYLLLFGRGSYDYKEVINNNTNYVPIYESRNSLHPLETYASDDYFGFLESDEGDWEEISSGNHTLEIGVGRLPVTSTEQSKNVVDKIIHYTSSNNTLGDWRNNVLLVADDGDFNLHQRQVIELSQYLDTTYSAFLSSQFMLDNYQQISRPSGETSPDASKALDEKIDDGALIVNFTGHGGESGWMQEQILDIVQIQNWDNYDKLPLFVTATCEFGRHDDPQKTSGGELIVTSPNGAGIAIVSTCRPVNSSSNFALNKAFYENVYKKNNGEYLRLGDIFRLTKNESINLASDLKRVGNRNFALLGDPTLKLNYPKKEVIIVGINSPNIKSDTLKALSKVTLYGQVNNNNGSIDNSFNGEVSYSIFDKPIQKTTLGNENSPFSYSVKENLIFKGKSSIINGQFEIEFIVPKNISYQVDNGFINMYAISDDKIDGNGAEINLKVGGSTSNPLVDNASPKIKLFIGDTLNTNLSLVSHNTHLVAILEDESGINLSSFAQGNNITAILDNTEEYNLNNYYQAFEDTYKRGVVQFPLNNLSQGKHNIKLKVWDTYNNSSESEIVFTVADPNSVVIYNIDNYPNPFRDQTTFRLSHNKSGEDLEIDLEILSPIAGSILKQSTVIRNSDSIVEFYNWNGRTYNGEKLNPGIYIYQVTVRSIRDGVKNTAQKKLILFN